MSPFGDMPNPNSQVTVTVAIAGTAGRKEDADKIGNSKYGACAEAIEWILEELPQDHKTLVSGGAAFADHLAVELFLRGKATELLLHLPCEFLLDKKQFLDTGDPDWRVNPGKIANYYHKQFKEKCFIDSLNELAEVLTAPNCTHTISRGFHARNNLMAKAEVLIACTFGDGPVVKDGGTAHTVKAYLENVSKLGREDQSWHIDLNTRFVKIHKGIKLSGS
jgi:hypothetical protein